MLTCLRTLPLRREGLSTALVFKALQLDACSSVEPSELLAAFQSSGALTAAQAALLVNDLEKPAFFCNPDLLSLKTKIAEEIVGASGVMMSGSGTSIYAVVDSAVPADRVNAGVNAVLKSFPTVQHFESDFLNKENDLLNWY
jgi:4-diphosphocytidyl-2C-methyl-D-erythritol kinase